MSDDGGTARARARWETIQRPLLAFVVAFIALTALAGTDALKKPSGNNHFVHLAEGWLDGRLSLEGKPPGYCTAEKRRAKKCRRHTHDDWAVVYTLEWDDGQIRRAYRCRTQACREEAKTKRTLMWRPLDSDEPFGVKRRELAQPPADTWYVTFPPGSAVLMLPGVALFGLGFLDVLFTAFIAALIAPVLVHFLDRERGRQYAHLWLALAWTLGSPACFLGSHGRVWFTAQMVGALFLFAYLSAAWRCRAPARAGLWLGMAAASRGPHLGLAIAIYLYEHVRLERPRRELLRFLAPLSALALAVALHNYARFDDVFEFGHRYLDIRWQDRMQEIGMFDLQYLARNLECLLWLWPQAAPGFPGFKVSLHGSALWLGSPWVLAVAAARDPFPQRWVLLATAVALALPSLLYQNSGQLQYSYRFAVDWLPLLVVGLAFGGAANRRWFPPLVLASVLFQSYGAYHYDRNPRKIFVIDPLGWPFEDELKEG